MGRMTAAKDLPPSRFPPVGALFFVCPCGARVGCHPRTALPIGRPASGATRALRHQAHTAFDAIWLGLRTKASGATVARRAKAYKWLARQLGIRTEDCHIGWFNAAECRRVIEICTQNANRKAA